MHRADRGHGQIGEVYNPDAPQVLRVQFFSPFASPFCFVLVSPPGIDIGITMSLKLASSTIPLRAARRAAANPVIARSYAQAGREVGFTSRDLIPDEPSGPSVLTGSVPGPAGKAAVSLPTYPPTHATIGGS